MFRFAVNLPVKTEHACNTHYRIAYRMFEISVMTISIYNISLNRN